MKTLVIAIATAGLCGAAQAAEPVVAPVAPAYAPLVEVDNDDVPLWPGGPTADQVDDAKIYSPGGDRIGEVEKVLTTPDRGNFAAAVDLRRRYGGRDVVVWFGQLMPHGEEDFVVALSQAELDALPTWDD